MTTYQAILAAFGIMCFLIVIYSIFVDAIKTAIVEALKEYEKQKHD